MSTTQTYKHWRLESDADNTLWVYFDKQNASVNTMDREVMEEFSLIVDAISADPTHKGVILASGKKSGFIAGADIAQFTQFKDIDEGVSVLTLGQNILNKFEALKIPTVAMIDGFCLGGGLELVLACHYRVAEESSKTRLGLPEVRLGIHPGWGGTVRLPRLTGAINGLDLILTGRTVSGKVAAKLGFVDAAVPKRQLVHAAKYYAMKNPGRHKLSMLQSLMNQKLVRQVIAHMMRKKLKAKVNPQHYPAPYHVVDNWELLGVEGDAAYAKEAKSCGKLFFSETCQNLVRVFFLQDRMKSLSKSSAFKPKRVHVIGAGTMGGDIAAWCAAQGFIVTLQDLEPRYIAPAIKRAAKLFKDKFKEPSLVQKALDNLIPDLTGDGIRNADVIIEAVIEDLDVKQSTFKMIESKAKPDAILATNTSSIPLDEINAVMLNRNRLVGIHFFNPVAMMMLVEVVQGEHTSSTVVENAISFVRRIDRLPLPVKSSPGFLVNRILMPYLLESIEMVKEGIPMQTIDKAMTDFGMPMGPVTLADTVGLDVCYSVAKYLGSYYHTAIPQQLIEKVEQRKLGRKTGEGFYKYDKNGKKISEGKVAYDKPLTDISNRLVLTMLNEAFACLREGVVADGDLLDAGMIFGTGFAPFRGGPMHYAKSQGISELHQQYVKQQQSKGDKSVDVQPWETTAV